MRNQKPTAEERSEGPLYRGDPQRRASGLEGPTVSPFSRCLELYLREREPNAKALAEERCVLRTCPSLAEYRTVWI